ncbi:hypothetical protein D3C72_2535060 [compost metagenome]
MLDGFKLPPVPSQPLTGTTMVLLRRARRSVHQNTAQQVGEQMVITVPVALPIQPEKE